MPERRLTLELSETAARVLFEELTGGRDRWPDAAVLAVHEKRRIRRQLARFLSESETLPALPKTDG